jgi:NAD dependent epimerase/dehydratase family enzyme
MSWIHIKDEIRCIQFLMGHKDLSGIFNLTAPHPLQNKLFSRELGKLLKRPSWFPVPTLFLRLFLGNMAEETILTSQRVLPSRLEKAGFKFAYPELTGALAHLLGEKS